jgi:hypothetical protein
MQKMKPIIKYTDNAVEFYVQTIMPEDANNKATHIVDNSNNSSESDFNADHALHEHVYKITKCLAHKIPQLKVVNLDNADYIDDGAENIQDIQSLTQEELIIDGAHYGIIFATHEIMSQLAILLNLHNYLQLPKASAIKWSKSTNIMGRDCSLLAGEYLYTHPIPHQIHSTRACYLSIKLSCVNSEYTFYLDAAAIKYLAYEFLRISAYTPLTLINMYGYALADMLVSIISCQFKLPLELVYARPAYLKAEHSYLPLFFKDGNTAFTLLMPSSQAINLDLFQNDVRDISNTNHRGININATMELPLLAGSASLTAGQFAKLRTGDVFLFDDCCVPEYTAVVAGNTKILFSPADTKLTLSQITVI